MAQKSDQQNEASSSASYPPCNGVSSPDYLADPQYLEFGAWAASAEPSTDSVFPHYALSSDWHLLTTSLMDPEGVEAVNDNSTPANLQISPGLVRPSLLSSKVTPHS
jgi:hypothetical protein